MLVVRLSSMTVYGAMKSRGLSKSKLLSGLQCFKRLWLEIHRPELTEFSSATEQSFAVGHRVGDVARQLVAGGVLIGSDTNLKEALAETRAQIEAGTKVLFEPTFEYDGVLIRADILTLADGRVRINEVKASTKVKDYFLSDAAIQTWVVENSGLKVESIAIQHIDNAFVYPGGGKYEGLFAEVAVDREIVALVEQVPKWVAAARETLAGGEPKIEMGKQCKDPYGCPFIEHCGSQVPKTEFPLTLLPNVGRTLPGLLAEGYRDLKDIPEGRLRSEVQERVRRAHVSGKAHFDPAVRKFMEDMPYPRAFLDFETINFAVPIWRGTRPYQQVPFQWSLHVESLGASTRHDEFLDLTGDLPAEPLLRALLDALPDHGPIFAYNSGFESRCLGELAELGPADRKSQVERVQARLVDLLPLTRNHYYHPDMEGSWSLKAVIPTVPGGSDYSDLGEVQEGGAAQLAYAEAIAPETSPRRKVELRDALLKYCERDTEATLILARYLQSGPT